MSAPTLPRGLNLTVGDTNKNKTEWVQVWHHWFFGIESKDNPSYGPSDYGNRSIDYNQGRIPADWPPQTGRKVYFLAGAAGTQFTTRSIIPAGGWQCIIVPVYIMTASRDEFPSVEDLPKFVKNDVDGTKTRKATLDGQSIPDDRIERIQIYEPFTVGLPDENILDLDTPSTDMISDGYWIFLDPKQILAGDHILSVLGQSPNYLSDTTYNLCIKG
jgi:hypothetical protein